jgi:hypothetical protein
MTTTIEVVIIIIININSLQYFLLTTKDLDSLLSNYLTK